MAKRLVLFTRIHIVLFALSLLALVSRWDSFDLRADIRGLDWLEIVNETELSYDPREQENVPLWNVNSLAFDWLERNNPAIWEEHRQVRDELTNLLQNDYHISEEALVDVKGRSFQGQENKFTLLEIDVDDALRPSQRFNVSDYTVRELTDRLLLLTTPLTMPVATELVTHELPNYAEYAESLERLDDSGRDSEIGPLVLSSVFLQDNIVKIRFTEDDSSLGFSQRDPMTLEDEISMIVSPLEGPSLFSLLSDLIPDEEAEVEQLRSNLDRLNQVYGNLKLGLAQSIAAEDFTRSYRSIALFGFTVSTRRFPFAVLLLSFLAAWGISWTVQQAIRSSKQIISNVQDEDVVDAFIDVPEIRYIVWGILPPLTIIASLPAFPLSPTEQAVMVVGLALVAFLGLTASWQSRRL